MLFLSTNNQTTTTKVAAVSKTDSKPKAIITLVPEGTEEELTNDNTTVFMLRTVPAQNNSPTYKSYCCILKGGKEVRALVK